MIKLSLCNKNLFYNNKNYLIHTNTYVLLYFVVLIIYSCNFYFSKNYFYLLIFTFPTLLLIFYFIYNHATYTFYYRNILNQF